MSSSASRRDATPTQASSSVPDAAEQPQEATRSDKLRQSLAGRGYDEQAAMLSPERAAEPAAEAAAAPSTPEAAWSAAAAHFGPAIQTMTGDDLLAQAGAIGGEAVANLALDYLWGSLDVKPGTDGYLYEVQIKDIEYFSAKIAESVLIDKQWLGDLAGMRRAEGVKVSHAEFAKEAEDAAALHDIDGEIDLFKDVKAVHEYFKPATLGPRWEAPRSGKSYGFDCLEEYQYDGVSPFETNALVGYTGPAYAPMNRLTRGQMVSQRYTQAFQLYVDAASDGISALGQGSRTPVQRGWRSIPGGDPALIHSLYDREFIEEKGFMSTSANSGGADFFQGPVSLNIHTRTGFDVQHVSVNPGEGEILLAPGTRFKVVRFQRNADVEDGWAKWHADQSLPQPGRPWFEVELVEQ